MSGGEHSHLEKSAGASWIGHRIAGAVILRANGEQSTLLWAALGYRCCNSNSSQDGRDEGREMHAG